MILATPKSTCGHAVKLCPLSKSLIINVCPHYVPKLLDEGFLRPTQTKYCVCVCVHVCWCMWCVWVCVSVCVHVCVHVCWCMWCVWVCVWWVSCVVCAYVWCVCVCNVCVGACDVYMYMYMCVHEPILFLCPQKTIAMTIWLRHSSKLHLQCLQCCQCTMYLLCTACSNIQMERLFAHKKTTIYSVCILEGCKRFPQ